MRYSKNFNLMFELCADFAKKRNKFMPDKKSLFNLAQREFTKYQAMGIAPTWNHYCMEKIIEISNKLAKMKG